MRWNGEFWEGAMTANRATVGGSELTLAKLRETMEALRPPPEMRFDLYAHTLDDRDAAYEIDRTQVMPWDDGEKRRFMVVHRDRLEFVADSLRKAGCEVRVEPRIRPVTPPEASTK